MIRQLAVAIVVIATWIGIGAGDARAYPQYTLSHEPTCTGCHLSPAGGNLLNENGLAMAEAMSQFGTAPEFFYGKVPTPGWLTLGGDLRGAGGYLQSPTKTLVAFPMQIEAYAAATAKNFSLHVTFGSRPTQVGNEGATHVWSREHYLMWQQHAGGSEGLYVRAGRFMPVFGLRLAEHPAYTRRYGGTPLYSETYGAAVEYIDPKWEAHLTGFIDDPVINTVDPKNGVAGYAEVRLGEHAAVGAEGMYAQSADDKKIRAGVTGKVYVPQAKLLLQSEVQFVNQLIDTSPTNKVGGAPLQIVGYLLGSFTLGDAYLLDVGLGHYDSNIRFRLLDRDCIDINLHWFTTSHLELLLTNRVELLGFTEGGPTGAYSLVQVHYRL
jgi:hypothetical protein